MPDNLQDDINKRREEIKKKFSSENPNDDLTSPLTPLLKGEGDEKPEGEVSNMPEEKESENELSPLLSGEGQGGEVSKSEIPYQSEKARALRKSGTPAEEKLWQILRNRKVTNLKFRRQHPIGYFIVDFYCDEKKLIIEIDGSIHDVVENKEYDLNRQEELTAAGYKIIRFRNEKVLKNIEEVIERIKDEVSVSDKRLTSPLTPLLKGEGNDNLNPFITEFDIHLFSKGNYYKIFEKFGSHEIEHNGEKGVYFVTWAPNAEAISIIGEFNGWTANKNFMKCENDFGVWDCFIPGLKEGDTYKYSIKPKGSETLLQKADPYAFRSELRPKDASIVHNINKYKWKDSEWMKKRKSTLSPLLSGEGQGGEVNSETKKEVSPWKSQPLNIYEVHLPSWRRDYENSENKNEWGFLSYGELAHEIVAYVKKMGYTHVELMPVMEHPLDISWGYQVTSYYAPTSRFGDPEGFMYFVDHCHQNGIGVILDWVPAHFPADDHSLAYFDGKQIYAYENWKKAFQKDWNTYVFDYAKPEVQNFLIGSAMFWLEKYHADGLRFDAVASMLYLDYSREQGEWEPNINGGRENLEAIEFLKHLNAVLHEFHPDVLTIAEESTAWPKVSHPVSEGGLGFDMKWNMGWMNDILLYFSKDPVHRKYHQGKITFSLWYAFTENFVLPISHDEVVHGKKSLLQKMPGDTWQKFANLRLFLGFMFAHPGKKLNFMTTDIAQYNEWNSEVSLERNLLELEMNAKHNKFAEDLSHLYKEHPAMHEIDFDSGGFGWIDFSDALNSVLSFVRYSKDKKEILLFTFNMTPVIHYDYPVGVPKAGFWKEILNSDSEIYGGSGSGNMGGKQSEEIKVKDWEHSIKVNLPPLGMNVYKLEGNSSKVLTAKNAKKRV